MTTGNQCWTAVVSHHDRFAVMNHFGSFSSETARREIESNLGEGSQVIALVPGHNARNFFVFNESEGTSERDWTQFIDPFEYTRKVP